MRSPLRVFLVAVASALVLAAGVVGCPAAHDAYPGKACKTDNDCYLGEICVNLECAPPPPDMPVQMDAARRFDLEPPTDAEPPPTDADDGDLAEGDL